MTVTLFDLEALKRRAACGGVWLSEETGMLSCLVGPNVFKDGVDVPLADLIALAIHGLNCQAAGITAERLGDIQMVPVIDMDEVRA